MTRLSEVVRRAGRTALPLLFLACAAASPVWSGENDCPPNMIATVAGNGYFGYSGDGEYPTATRLNAPRAIAVGPDGSLYIADTSNNRVRKVERPGRPGAIITTIAGDGRQGYSGDGGPATQASLNWPSGVAVGHDGSIYIVDLANRRVRKVDPDGTITTVAGNGSGLYHGDGGPATEAGVVQPTRVAVGPDGALYIADTYCGCIRRVDADGIIVTIAGGGPRGRLVDGRPALHGRLAGPMGMAIAGDGSVYVAEETGYRIRRIGPEGIITTVAGSGTKGYSGDGGRATAARLTYPQGVALGPDGSLYIVEYENCRVRKIDPAGIITTIAGTGRDAHSGDGGPAAADVESPSDVGVGPDGSLYVCEKLGPFVRRICPERRGGPAE